MRAAIYCRVSTADQSCDRQARELRAFAQRLGAEVVGIFRETASGAKNDRAERKKVLVINAMKHAFAVHGAGSIQLRLAATEPGWAELAYSDSGADFPADFSIDRSARSGLKLVDALARQLGGGVQIEKGPPKTVRIRFQIA